MQGLLDLVLICIMEIRLSAVIITFNEERNIERCLKSLDGIADEIIVVDSFSTDSTESICIAAGAKFIQHEFEGHIEQKNWAKEQASFDHILSLDADEALDEQLKSAIKDLKQNWQHDGYQMNRMTNFCGQWIKHSGWYPDVKLRLFDRRKAAWGGDNPHDKIIMMSDEKTSHLKGNILHYSFYTLEEHMQQIHKFSSIGAKALYKKGKKSSLLKCFYKPTARFIKAFILQKGFLDGHFGWIISTRSAYANYLKYRKLRLLQQGKTIER